MGSRKVTQEYAKIWKDNLDKEQKLRLNWFRKNEARLVKDAEAPLKRQLDDNIKKEKIENYKTLFSEVERFPQIRTSDPEPLDYDPDCLAHPMRPVDYKTKQLLYTGTQQDGRVNYLKERAKTIPEQKYYFPETTSFRYGWKMWDHAMSGEGGTRLGKSQIIKQTFYRRRGVTCDPMWYRDPIRLSPTVCDIK